MAEPPGKQNPVHRKSWQDDLEPIVPRGERGFCRAGESPANAMVSMQAIHLPLRLQSLFNS